MAAEVPVTVTWKIKPEAADKFIEKLKGDFERVVEQPGFRSIRLHRGDADQAKFILVEEWDSAQSFNDYMSYRNTKGNVAEFFEWSSAAPEVAIYELQSTLEVSL